MEFGGTLPILPTEESLEEQLEKAQEECEEESCQDAEDFLMQPPEEPNSFGGFNYVVKTSLRSKVFLECPKLPDPNDMRELKDIAEIMTLNKDFGLTEQPLQLMQIDNNLFYFNAMGENTLFTSTAKMPEGSTSTYYFLNLVPDDNEKVKYDSTTEDANITYLCFDDPNSSKFEQLKFQVAIQDIINLIKNTKDEFQHWFDAIMKCKQNDVSSPVKTAPLIEHPIEKLVPKLYRTISEFNRKELTVGNLAIVKGAVLEIKHQIGNMQQMSDACLIEHCLVDVRRNTITLLCNEPVRQTGYQIITNKIPFSSDNGMQTLLYDTYSYDLQFTTCYTMQLSAKVYIDTDCCRELAHSHVPNSCPTIPVYNAPLTFSQGPNKYITQQLKVNLNCDGKMESYEVMPSDPVTTDCDMSLAFGENNVYLNGLGDISPVLPKLIDSLDISDQMKGIIGLNISLFIIILGVVIKYLPKIYGALTCCRGRGQGHTNNMNQRDRPLNQIM